MDLSVSAQVLCKKIYLRFIQICTTQRSIMRPQHSKKRCVNLTHLFVQILTHFMVGFKTRLKVCLTHPKLGFTTHLKVCLTHVKVC